MDSAVGGEAGEDLGKLILQRREVDVYAVGAPQVGLVGVSAVGAAADHVAQGLDPPDQGQGDGARGVSHFQGAVYVEAEEVSHGKV